MQTYVLAVDNRTISLVSDDDTLVRTSRGIDEIRLEFADAEWADYDLSLALTNGSTVEIPITLENMTCTVAVPDSILERDGPLGVAVHGTDDAGNHIITAHATPLTIEHEGDAADE